MEKTGVYPVFENKFKIGASAESLNLSLIHI